MNPQYHYFSNGNIQYSILKTSVPKEYENFSSPIFCDMDDENLRFIVDFWRNNCVAKCKEQQAYDLMRLKMDHFEPPLQKKITLTVGHCVFHTTVASLEKLPYFVGAFNMNKDFQNNIDRDAVYFKRLLSHCRHPLQYPLHSLEVPVEELAYFGLCPKYLRLWDEKKDPNPKRVLKYFDQNSLSIALHGNPQVTLFNHTYLRTTLFRGETIFVDESNRVPCKFEEEDIGETVFLLLRVLIVQ